MVGKLMVAYQYSCRKKNTATYCHFYIGRFNHKTMSENPLNLMAKALSLIK